MRVIAISDWYALTAGICLLVGLAVLVFLAWWALFADRPGERRRCPRCWYDLTYAEGTTCAECGYEAGAEKDLRRVRRRLRLATFAILGCVTIGLFTLDRVKTRGWITYVPTRIILALVPLAGNTNGDILTELQRRIRGGEIEPEHWLVLLDRCRVGDDGARPPTDAWIAKYGRPVDTARVIAETAEDEDYRAAVGRLLLDVPPRIDFRTRSVWPAHVAPTVDVRARSWWPRGTQWRIRAEPQIDGAEPVEHVLLDAPIQRRSYSLVLPVLPPGRHEVPIELTLSRRSGSEDAWETLRPLPIDVAITVSENASATLEPVSGGEFDDAVRAVFAGGLVKYRGGSLPVRVDPSLRSTFSVLFEDTAVGLRVEVMRNGKRARRLDMWWLAGAGEGSGSAWEVPWHDDDLLGAPASPRDVWTIHARGDLELALRAGGGSKYWAGDITVDVPIRFHNDSAPNRGWVEWDGAEPDRPAR